MNGVLQYLADHGQSLKVATYEHGGREYEFAPDGVCTVSTYPESMAGNRRYRDVQGPWACDVKRNAVTNRGEVVWSMPGEEDSRHVNGVAVNGTPQYVTMLGTSTTAQGWRKSPGNSGVVVRVGDSKIVESGQCFPHSPRLHNGELYWLQAGRGWLCSLFRVACKVPGFARGLAFHGDHAFIGLSKMRKTDLFEHIELDEQQMRCGVAMLVLSEGEIAGTLDLDGVREISNVQVMPAK